MIVDAKNSIEFIDNESSILEMKIKLELARKNLGKISKEQTENNIEKMQQSIAENEDYRQNEEEDLIKQKHEYKVRNLYYQKYEREISSRDEYHTAVTRKQHDKQNINESHEYGVYRTVQEYDNKIVNSRIGIPEGQDFLII